jgi:hypothetical protein
MFRTEGLCSVVWEKPGKGYPPVDTLPLNFPLGCRTLNVVPHLIRYSLFLFLLQTAMLITDATTFFRWNGRN